MKKVVSTSCALALSSAYYFTCQHSDYFKQYELFRMGRTIFTVGEIAYQYKKALSRKENPCLDKTHSKCGRKLLDLAVKNGGVYVKVGQHLASLNYMLPEPFTRPLTALHSNAPKVGMDDICYVFQSEFGCNIADTFAWFDAEPLGTASLAQVHKAQLRQSGRLVAVKVQHRLVRDSSQFDMRMMEASFAVVKRLFPQMNFEWIARETRLNLPRELDFQLEAENADRVRSLLSRTHQFLRVPHIVPEFSSSRVITMEFVEGICVTDVDRLRAAHIDPVRVSQRLAQLYSDMIFEKGFVHCDPHPGNILIMPIKKTMPANQQMYDEDSTAKTTTRSREDFQVALLDHGLYTTLSNQFRLDYCNLWKQIINANEEGMREAAQQLGCPDLHRLLSCVVSGRSWKALESGIINSEQDSTEVEHIKQNIPQYFPNVVAIFNRIPREMILIMKTIDCLKGIDFSLGGKRLTAFLEMAVYCYRVIAADRMETLRRELYNSNKSGVLRQKICKRLTYPFSMISILFNLYFNVACIRFMGYYRNFCLTIKS